MQTRHSIATCPEYQLGSPGDRYNLVSQNNLCTNCLGNKHHKQSCPSQKRCEVCSGFHQTTLHDPAKQIKRPTAAFSTEVFLVAIQQLRLVVKLQVKLQIHLNRKVKTNKAPNSCYCKTFSKKYNDVM